MTLPASNTELLNALSRVQNFAQKAAGNAGTYIKLTKAGQWVHGPDEIEVEEGSRWAVNPESIEFGFTAWNDQATQTGERMAGLYDTPITLEDLPPVDGKWSEQVGLAVRCLDGEDKDMDGLVYMSSKGGLRAMRGLISEILTEVDVSGGGTIPVIKFKVDSYRHKKYGKIFIPVFELDGFFAEGADEAMMALQQADPEPEPEPAPEPEPEVKPTRRTRRARK